MRVLNLVKKNLAMSIRNAQRLHLVKTARCFFLAAAVAASSVGAWAASTTYYQVKNWECAYELASGVDGVEIGYTPHADIVNVQSALRLSKPFAALSKLFGSMW